MVGIVGFGAEAGDGRSLTGISTSSEPTLYGPVNVGKAGRGLKREKKAIMKDWTLPAKMLTVVYGSSFCAQSTACKTKGIARYKYCKCIETN